MTVLLTELAENVEKNHESNESQAHHQNGGGTKLQSGGVIGFVLADLVGVTGGALRNGAVAARGVLSSACASDFGSCASALDGWVRVRHDYQKPCAQAKLLSKEI
mmetsp:Transcript_18581/g.27246  ORF Transcript_18581/g.27246 Transcript_18581/m.27246 type:complete len:105 (+) Transcript_18581:107-421(+)|eukprot:CAMPEP_0195517854 /NCGR_PEP_ID=MMETSP0794_2-20130614/11789_1 /TAXON_ID=515487 /ORGANISM="Stephanopyxis turris, Strain CCMP 815" /LENGTH=104 /DNA_ID=CAMNT_0040646729 /DNA_START=106 /DNA_END=420 /DNA_ORIENTATION=+